MRGVTVGWALAFVSAFPSVAPAAPVPKPRVDPQLVGRWRMVGISFDLAKSPITPTVLPAGMDLVYVFGADGRLELRNEFSHAEATVRLGRYEVYPAEVRHTAVWDREQGQVLTMRVVELTPTRLVVTEDGVTRAFERVAGEPAPTPRRR